MIPTKKTKFAAVLLIVTALTISTDLNSQPWFGQINHNQNNSTFDNGHRVFSLSLGMGMNSWGYVRSGHWPASTPASPNFNFSYLDVAGGYGAGAFYAEYDIIDDAASCSSPVKKTNCNGVMVTNAANTGGAEVFALAGVYDEGVFFSSIDVNGNPVSTYRWDWPTVPNRTPRKPFINTCYAPFGTFYITGDFDNIMYVIKVDATTTPATPKWARFYYSGDSLTSRAVLHSPYDTSEVVVVGSRYGSLANGAMGHEGFLLKLDNPTGNIISLDTYGDPDGRDAWFTSIKKADCTWGGSDGYLLGGYCDSYNTQNTNFPQWMTKLDPNGNTIWSSLIQPIYVQSMGQRTTWEIADVSERYNPTSGFYENYGVAGSTINNGSFTYDYLTVFKLDEDGTTGALTPTEFRYMNNGRYGVWSSSYIEYGESGTVGGGANDGLQMWAQEFVNNDHTFVKSYFNGVSGCNDSLTDIINIKQGPTRTQQPNYDYNNFNANCPNMFSLNVNFPPDNLNQICYNSSVTGGVNTRMMATGIKGENSLANEIKVYPNPSKALLFIKGNENKLQNAVINIQNNMGQNIAVFNADQIRSTTDASLSLDFNKLNVAEGIYLVRITDTFGRTANYKIVYNKD